MSAGLGGLHGGIVTWGVWDFGYHAVAWPQLSSTCQFTVKTEVPITKRYPSSSHDCQIYSSLLPVHSSNPTSSWLANSINYPFKYGNSFLLLLVNWHNKHKMINGSHGLKFSGTINVSPSRSVPFLETRTSSSSTKEPEVSETGSKSFLSGLLEQSHPSHSSVPSSNTEPYNHQWFKEKSGKLCKVPELF